MSDFSLVEKYDDVTPIPSVGSRPPYMEVLPKDSVYVGADEATQEAMTKEKIRSQSDYVAVTDPKAYLHSMMKNEFYENLTFGVTDELQFLVDRADVLKNLYNIDLYDGDQTTFFEKISHLLELFDFGLPLFFGPLTNAEKGTGSDITKENDYYRNVVKHMWLTRRWAGTSNGYNLLFKFINRLGSVHLAVKYITGDTITQTTNKVYRLLDMERFSLIAPGGSNTTFPNAGHIPPITNLSKVKGIPYKYDTGLSYDEGNVRMDQTIPFSSSGKQLYLEISLDRLLKHVNSIGTTTCLMDNDFLSAVDYMLPSVRRAQDLVNIGTQLSLVASKDGKVNTLSGDSEFSHPNIKAKFQLFKYLPDKTTPNWNAANVSYIKVGSGGYGVTDIDSNVFVKSTESVTGPTKWVPTDLQSPVFATKVGESEKDFYGNYNVFNISVHPRDIEANSVAGDVLVNGATTSNKVFRNTTTLLTHNFIAKGSLSLGLNIDINIPELVIDEGATGITFSPVTKLSSTTYTFSVNSVSGASVGVVTVGDVTRTISDVSSINAVASQIGSLGVTPVSGEWIFTVSGADITATSKLVEHHQRLFVYQKFNPFKNEYDPTYKYQERDDDGTYHDFTDSLLLQGYTNDLTYADTDYFPNVQKQIVNLLPLCQLDKYPELQDGLVGWWNMNDTFTAYPNGTSTYFQDDWATVDGWGPNLANLSVSDGYLRVTLTSAGGNCNKNVGTPNFVAGNHLRIQVRGTPGKRVDVDYHDSTTYPCLGSVYLTSEWQVIDVILPADSINNYIYIVLANGVAEDYFDIDWIYMGAGGYTTPIVDNSGNNRNGTMMGTLPCEGVNGNALQFNKSFCQFPSGTAVMGSSDFTATAWVYRTGAIADSFIICNRTGSFSNGFGIRGDNTSAFGYLISANPNIERYTSAVSLPLNTWSFIVLTVKRSTGVMQFSVNMGNPVSVSIADMPNALDTDLFCMGTFARLQQYSITNIRIDEVRIYNRILSTNELSNLRDVTSTQDEPLYNSSNEQTPIYINEDTGKVTMKLQYNPNGPLSGTPLLTQQYTTLSTTMSQKYKLNISNTNVKISELGLFDASDHLMAYATFPPVIYDASKYHLSFNLLTEKTQ